MKKRFAILLAVVMMATMALPTLAATALTDNPSKGAGVGDYTIGVNGTYVAGAAAEDKISVDIAWETMSFTYTAGDKTYDAGTHTTGTKPGSWSTNKPGITVTNHSNVTIEAGFTFTQGTGVTTTGSFYASADATTALAAAAQKLSLESAAGKTRNDTDATLDESPKGTLYFGVSGDAISENKSLGTITVKIAKDDKVYTGEQLQAALEKVAQTGGTVKLGADVTLPTQGNAGFAGCIIDPGNGKEITLDLNGHTVTGLIVVNDRNGTGKLFVKNGTVQYSTEQTFADAVGVICGYNTYIEIDHVTINATGFLAALNDGGNMKIMDATLKGGQNDNSNHTITVWTVNGHLTFSGVLSVENDIRSYSNDAITAEAGTYNFDPSDYVGEGYTVTESNGTYTVTANAD